MFILIHCIANIILCVAFGTLLAEVLPTWAAIALGTIGAGLVMFFVSVYFLRRAVEQANREFLRENGFEDPDYFDAMVDRINKSQTQSESSNQETH